MLLPDLRHSLRSLRRAPGLTTVSVITVALGIGAGTSLFSVVKAVLLNPLPYPQAERIAWIEETTQTGDASPVAYGNFRDWAQQSRSFSALAAYGSGPITASGDFAERVVAAEVSSGFFNVMGVHPTVGREFLASEQVPGAAIRAIIGYGLWQRQFGGAPSAVGRTLRFAGKPVTVVGVMPAGFNYPGGSEVWVSVAAMGDEDNSRTAHNFLAVGRLRPGAGFKQAQADLDAIMRPVYAKSPGPFTSKSAAVTSLATHIAGDARPALLVLFGAVGFLLLIVCVNVANLLLARVSARSRELAVRRALGAGRRQLFRQMLTESILLSLAGGSLGLLIAVWSLEVLKILLPVTVPRAGEIRIDGGVIAFAFAVSCAAGLLFGLLPAWRATHMNLNIAIKSGSRGYTAGRKSHRMQSALVVSEVALSLVLLAGAGMLVRSFLRLASVDPGFRTDRVLTAQLAFPSVGDDGDVPRLRNEYGELLTRVRAIPGVTAAGTINDLPLNGFVAQGSFRVENRTLPPDAEAIYTVISPGYLRAMGIPIRSGRDFSDRDSENGAGAIILSSEMARHYWPGRNPIGERIWFESMEQKEHWLTVVGVAADVHQSGLRGSPAPQAYVCYMQARRLANATLVIQSPMPPASVEDPVRRALAAVDRETTVSFRTMSDILAVSMARQRFQMQVLSGFAGLALVLAAVGLYGVLSYVVASNRGQIGIRVALGAQPGAVFRMVAKRALRLAGVGVAIGLAGCLAVRSALQAVLFGIGPSDPATLAVAAAVLLAVAMVAASVPALRAMRVDPISVLREE